MTHVSTRTFADAAGKPGKPEIIDYDNRMVQLQWEPPKSDGGAPIEKYIVQKKDKFSPEWEKIAESKGAEPTARVEPLVEGTEMQFRIIAINKGGASEPSDATDLHKVKHRKRKYCHWKGSRCVYFSKWGFNGDRRIKP